MTAGSTGARALVGNGALLILVGLLVGLAVGAAPYPRLMLTAHIQFVVNGMLSVLAGLVLWSAAAAGAPGAARWQEVLVIACHFVPGFLLIIAWALLVLGVRRTEVTS